jgi:hypothetical protein
MSQPIISKILEEVGVSIGLNLALECKDEKIVWII